MTSKEKERKYALTAETQEVAGHTLHRIVAVRRFGCVKKGEKGGWIEKESNLSHECNCWVYDDARVLDNAEVFGNAKVYDTAEVFGRGKVHGNAEVFHYAEVYGNAEVFHNAAVFGIATVRDRAMVYDNAKVCSSADVYGTAQVYGNAEVHGEAEMFGEAEIFGKAEVCGNARVSGKAVLRGDAVVSSKRDYIVFKNWWSSGRYFTWTRSNNLWAVGCFYGTGEELIRKAYKDSEQSGREYERIVRYVEEILKAEEK